MSEKVLYDQLTILNQRYDWYTNEIGKLKVLGCPPILFGKLEDELRTIKNDRDQIRRKLGLESYYYSPHISGIDK